MGWISKKKEKQKRYDAVEKIEDIREEQTYGKEEKQKKKKETVAKKRR